MAPIRNPPAKVRRAKISGKYRIDITGKVLTFFIIFPASLHKTNRYAAGEVVGPK